MNPKILISLDKFILLLLNQQPLSIEEINDKLIIFISSIWYQQWDNKNKSFINTIFDNILRIRYYFKGFFKRFNRLVPFTNGFIDIKKECDLLIKDNLVDFKNNKYFLTKSGQIEADKIEQSVIDKVELINNQFFEISQAERNNTLINFVLAILKLSGGYFSGCVALISDGYDAISDTISAFFVWVGIKFNYQKFTNLLVIIMLFIAGFSALYESGSKLYDILFATVTPTTHIGLVVIIELIAIFVALFLFTYERHIGKYKGNLTLISQSVDSKNHILTGIVVIIGSLFSLIGIHWLDAVIGIYIAFRILSDSVDLLKEFKHEVREGNIDYSKYKTFFGNYMKLNHNENFATWVLYKATDDYIDKNQLKDSYLRLLEDDYCPLISEIGISLNHDIIYDDIFNELLKLGAIEQEESYIKTTEKGNNHLIKILKAFSHYDANILDYFILKISDE